MKFHNLFGTLTSLILVVFILSLFSGTVTAQNTMTEKYEKTKEQFLMEKEKYENTKKKFEEAKDTFEKASKQLRDRKDNKSVEDLKLKGKDYILRSIERAESHLEVLKDRLESSENKGNLPFDAIKLIDSHISQLEALKTRVQQANTIQELRDAHKELKDIVNRINLETRYSMGIILNHRIDNFITKSDNVTVRLENAIEELKAQGNDTKKLEDDLADFKNEMKKAKESQNKTLEFFADHKGFASDGNVTDERDAKAFLKEANDLQRQTIKNLKEAGKDVIGFGRDLRIITGKKVKVDEKGELELDGDKTATLTATPGD